MKLVDERRALKAYVEKFETQREAAARLGLQPPHVVEILKGLRKCPTRVLNMLGLRRGVFSTRKSAWELSQRKRKRA